MKIVRDVVGSPSDRKTYIYELENGVMARDAVIEAGIGKEIKIGACADLHFNLCNEKDMEENLPCVMSTLEYRKWNANGASSANAERSLATLAQDSTEIVVLGDTLDYLSHGCMELMQKYVWDKYPDALVPLGGHDITRVMQGKIPDPSTLESRYEILEKFWKHDIFYASKLVEDKVICVALDNGRGRFYDDQFTKLSEDIEKARKNGYIILLFFHEPICTKNPAEACVAIEDVIMKGDPSGFPVDFCHTRVGGDSADEATRKVHDLITSSADVIKGVFAGHIHNEMYLEIIAKTQDGEDTVIPQYVVTANAYGAGHILNIIVK